MPWHGLGVDDQNLLVLKLGVLGSKNSILYAASKAEIEVSGDFWKYSRMPKVFDQKGNKETGSLSEYS